MKKDIEVGLRLLREEFPYTTEQQTEEIFFPQTRNFHILARSLLHISKDFGQGPENKHVEMEGLKWQSQLSF